MILIAITKASAKMENVNVIQGGTQMKNWIVQVTILLKLNKICIFFLVSIKMVFFLAFECKEDIHCNGLGTCQTVQNQHICDCDDPLITFQDCTSKPIF